MAENESGGGDQRRRGLAAGQMIDAQGFVRQIPPLPETAELPTQERAEARRICAQLLPHPTSVRNVGVIAAALTDARMEARLDAFAQVMAILTPSLGEGDYGQGWDDAINRIIDCVRALAEPPAESEKPPQP
jgi:hypothetical protein